MQMARWTEAASSLRPPWPPCWNIAHSGDLDPVGAVGKLFSRREAPTRPCRGFRFSMKACISVRCFALNISFISFNFCRHFMPAKLSSGCSVPAYHVLEECPEISAGPERNPVHPVAEERWLSRTADLFMRQEKNGFAESACSAYSPEILQSQHRNRKRVI